MKRLPISLRLPLLAAALVPTATTSLADVFYYTGTVQNYIVPTTGLYDITAYGAQGGGSVDLPTGGLGAEISGDFELTAGETLSILVGGQGGNGNLPELWSGGGGGGSLVAPIGNMPLVIAGGGGGAGYAGPTFGGNGQTGPNGQAGFGINGGAGGTGGNGGSAGTFGAFDGGGGAGLLGNGQDADGGGSLGGLGAVGTSGGAGGYSTAGGLGGDNNGGFGGFGGGGGGFQGGGGGGGYSGGGGGDGTAADGGGGGGSFIDPSGSNPYEIGGVASPDGSGNGFVEIVPAPEPAQWISTGLLMFGAGIVWMGRKKASQT